MIYNIMNYKKERYKQGINTSTQALTHKSKKRNFLKNERKRKQINKNKKNKRM